MKVERAEFSAESTGAPRKDDHAQAGTQLPILPRTSLPGQPENGSGRLGAAKQPRQSNKAGLFNDRRFSQIAAEVEDDADRCPGSMHSASLFFTEPHVEGYYRVDALRFVGAQSWELFGALAVFMVACIVIDIFARDGVEDTHDIKLAIQCSALGVAIGNLLVSRRLPQLWALWVSSGLLSAVGALWAVSEVVASDNDDAAKLPTVAAGTIAFLIAINTFGKSLLWPFLVAATMVTATAYTISAAVFRSDVEQDEALARQIILVWIAAVSLACFSYSNEKQRRQLFVHRTDRVMNTRAKINLRKEALELRGEVYNLVLEKYKIADVDQGIDLKSPVEQAMACLVETQGHPRLPYDAFLAIKRVITMLGSSSDIFTPDLDEQLQDKKIDVDTERWIVGLVEQTFDRGALSVETGEPDSRSLKEDTLSTPVVIRADESPGASQNGAGSRDRSHTRSRSARNSHVSPPANLGNDEEFQQLLHSTDNWDFDVFDVVRVTNGRPLFFVGLALFRKYDLIQKFKISPLKLQNFLTVIEQGYQDKPYHNSTHAADVTRTVHFFLKRGYLEKDMTDLEIFSALVASAIHDYAHPGLSNQFHIVTRDPKAILYNDKSVLENYHCAQAFAQVLKDENNIFENLTPQQYNECRKIIVDMVLATDLAHHFDFIGHFKSVVSSGTANADKKSPKFRVMALKMALKCADVGHAAKALHLHTKWTQRVIEEFYRQGDEERKRNIPISPFMDRQKANVPKAQVGFLDFLVVPMYEAFCKFLDLSEEEVPCLKHLQHNKEHWKAQSQANAGSSVAQAAASKEKDLVAEAAASKKEAATKAGKDEPPIRRSNSKVILEPISRPPGSEA